ncbi:hypothetical protein [Ornithinibacillus scapharcae]|uniref:hypothetical protein n=1 Tax=Ornithinibacillus scapharcae TaxID=1147159 RepID=UPI001300C17C|nr:hypothetical protein [Ornithinibacillus scapharcae]
MEVILNRLRYLMKYSVVDIIIFLIDFQLKNVMTWRFIIFLFDFRLKNAVTVDIIICLFGFSVQERYDSRYHHLLIWIFGSRTL